MCIRDSVLMNHNAADTVTIASDIVGGAGVTQDSSITFRRSANLNLNISGNVDYAGTTVSYTHLV